jgi:pyruvate/2-oxoglutarate dehydrogenase complex dihydrolipoamide acyltransferase (E2) component
VDIYGNRIDSCSNNAGTVKGIQVAEGDTVRVFNNILRNITASGASSTVKAIAIGTGGLSISVYNNSISDLETPASGANPAITGIELLGGAFLNVWHNTLRLHPATGTGPNFGVAGIFFNGTPIGVDISNNIVSVDAAPTGKGYVAALRRDAGVAGIVPANLTTINGNIWYVNTTAPHAYLYAEGADTTALTNTFGLDADFNTPCSEWKKFMSPEENNSFTEDNLAPTGSLDLYAPAGTSYARERAAALPQVPSDRDGVARPALADAGALQFTGTAIPAPVATGFAKIIPPAHNGFCTGDSLTLRAKVFAGMSYQWQKGSVDIPGATDTLLHVSQVGTYTVVANSGQCADTSVELVIVEYPLPTPAVSVNGSELSTGRGYTFWQWYVDGAAIPQANGPTHTATQSGSYTVAVTDTNGCTGMSAAQQVEVTNGIGSVTGKTTVRVYPNPASGKLYIAAPYAGKVSLSLSSIAGQEVLRQQHAAEMDISKLAPGMYILKITDAAGNLLQVEKIRKEDR